MQIQNDTISTVQSPPIAPAAEPRAPDVAGINPPHRAQDRKREGASQGRQRGASFRASLDAATSNGTGANVKSAEAAAATVAETVQRPTRLPDRGPRKVEHTEGAELFRQVQASPDEAPASSSLDESQHRFLKAAGSYAARFLSVASTFAKPGENLEISA